MVIFHSFLLVYQRVIRLSRVWSAMMARPPRRLQWTGPAGGGVLRTMAEKEILGVLEKSCRATPWMPEPFDAEILVSHLFTSSSSFRDSADGEGQHWLDQGDLQKKRSWLLFKVPEFCCCKKKGFMKPKKQKLHETNVGRWTKISLLMDTLGLNL